MNGIKLTRGATEMALVQSITEAASTRSLLMKPTLLRALTVLSCLLWQPLQAAELTDLYQAKVPAQAPDWQSQSLQAVLTKLTGTVPPALQSELKQAASYVVQYQQVQHNGQTELLVTLDSQKINQLLQQRQIAIWGARRADILLWLTEKSTDSPLFVMSPAHPVRQALQQAAERYGLALQYPLFDETDLALVAPQSSWGGDWAVLQQASARYQTPEVLNLLFDQYTDSSGLVQFRLSWQQWIDGVMQQRELHDADAVKLTETFARELAQQQYQRYAVQLGASNNNALTLTISGLEQWTAWVEVQQLFSSMLTVKSSHLLQFGGGEAQIRLQLAATEDEFYRNLALVPALTPQPDAPAATADNPVVDSSVVDRSIVDNTMTNEAMVASGVDNAAQTALTQDTNTANAATEALLEQALAEDSANTQGATDNGLESSGSVVSEQAGAVTAPVLVKASRYRYQRR